MNIPGIGPKDIDMKKRFWQVFYLCLFVGFLLTSRVFSQDLSEPELIPRKTQTQTQMQPGLQTTSPAESTQAPASAPATKPGNESAPAPTSVLGFDIDSVSMSWIVIGMLIGGFFLLLIEVAVIPGFGIIGLKGIILIFVALLLAYWRLDSKTAITYTIVSLLALMALSIWFLFVFPHTRLAKRFILDAKISVADGYTAAQDFSHFVGVEGIATSDLRPSGIARLGEERIEVMSEGDFIPRGTKIRALKIRQGNIIVVPIGPPKV